MVDSDKRRFGFSGGGFTLIELTIVVVILLIAAMVAIPMVTSAATFQRIKEGIHGNLSLDFGDPFLLRNPTNYILFYHCTRSFLTSLRDYTCSLVRVSRLPSAKLYFSHFSCSWSWRPLLLSQKTRLFVHGV